jgi:hypothetical protein
MQREIFILMDFESTEAPQIGEVSDGALSQPIPVKLCNLKERVLGPCTDWLQPLCHATQGWKKKDEGMDDTRGLVMELCDGKTSDLCSCHCSYPLPPTVQASASYNSHCCCRAQMKTHTHICCKA